MEQRLIQSTEAIFCLNCIDQRAPRRRRRETHLRLMRAARWGYLNITGLSSFRMSAQAPTTRGRARAGVTDHIPLMRKRLIATEVAVIAERLRLRTELWRRRTGMGRLWKYLAYNPHEAVTG